MTDYKIQFAVGDTVYFVWWNEIKRSTVTGFRIIVDSEREFCRYVVAPVGSAKEAITLHESKIHRNPAEVFEMLAREYSEDYGDHVRVAVHTVGGNANV